MSDNIVIAAAVRTAIGSVGGSLNSLPVMPEAPAMIVEKVSGSGLKSVHQAMQAVACGHTRIIIVGGEQFMSQSAQGLARPREGQRVGHWPLAELMIVDGLWDAFNQNHMGVTAETITQTGFNRESQGAFATASRHKAEAATKPGRLDIDAARCISWRDFPIKWLP